MDNVKMSLQIIDEINGPAHKFKKSWENFPGNRKCRKKNIKFSNFLGSKERRKNVK